VSSQGPRPSRPPPVAPNKPPAVVSEKPDARRLVPPNWLDDAPVTRALLALNIALFGVEVALTHQTGHLPARPGLELGASYGLATIGENRYETLLTACFLHDGWLHLAFNALVLWLAGPLAERAIGSARMAPMYAAAGVFGNFLSVAYGWFWHSGLFSVGASGAISGVLAAALVLGGREQGWRGPLTQAMVRWLGFVVLYGFVSNLGGARIDNAMHVGGVLAGAAIACLWQTGHRYSEKATFQILLACTGLLVACIAVVAIRDRTDRFATMIVQDRAEFTSLALDDGRCADACDGLRAVERLRGHMAPDAPLRSRVEMTCGHEPQSP
jgi:rhomboid protease GluP